MHLCAQTQCYRCLIHVLAVRHSGQLAQFCITIRFIARVVLTGRAADGPADDVAAAVADPVAVAAADLEALRQA